MTLNLLKATMDNSIEITNLLRQNQLLTEDIDLQKQHYFIAKKNNELMGICGLEIYNEYGLIRSFAIKESDQNTGIGKMLYCKTIDFAKELKLKELFLLTTTASDWFAKQGWILITRKDVPNLILESSEFKHLCPESASCMYLAIDGSSVELAISRFLAHYNCAQSVFSSWANNLGLKEKDTIKIASGFGAGMNYQGKTCGAVTGAYMALSNKFGFDNANDEESRKTLREKIDEFNRQFLSKYDSLECNDLLRSDISNESHLNKLRAEGAFRKLCPMFIKDASKILENLMK